LKKVIEGKVIEEKDWKLTGKIGKRKKLETEWKK